MLLDTDTAGAQPARGLALLVAGLLAFSALLALAAAVPHASSGSPSPVGPVATEAVGRDPYTWPFSRDSIWNLPIGASAAYVPATIAPVTQKSMFDEADVLILKPNAPPTPVYFNDDAWSSNLSMTRCAAKGGVLFSAPIPGNFFVPGAHMGSPHGDTPNYAAAILSSDNHTLIQGAPMARCQGFNPTMWWHEQSLTPPRPREDLYGTGISGGHGGSMLSAIGGTIRLGELVPNGTIRHAMKVDLWGRGNYYYDNVTQSGHRWPALTHDDSAPTEYTGRNPAMKLGALLALGSGFNVNSLETGPGLILAQAFQNYGGYTVDNAGWSVYMIATEFSPDGDVMTEFRNKWGFDLNVDASGSTGWSRDLNKIFASLNVVDNWNEALWNTVRASNGTQGSGGGTPRAPWAPPFGGLGTTLVFGATSPYPSRIGQTVSFSAVLTRRDYGTPLSGKQILFQASDDNGGTWWSAGTYLTDVNGRASGGTVFTWMGQKLLRAQFAGDAGYPASMSGTQPHTVTG